jgi:high-affinity nickel-transport protein
MIDTLPSHWLALLAVVFALGLKHGLDPDHLAAIDGLTRFNAGRRPRLSRWSGLLFSAGHGVVVTLVAIAVATLAAGLRAPEWLDDAGTWISIGFLALLGVANLHAVARTPRAPCGPPTCAATFGAPHARQPSGAGRRRRRRLRDLVRHAEPGGAFP